MQAKKLWDDLQSSLWFRPAIWLLFLAVLAIALTLADARLSQSDSLIDWPWFLVGGAEGARTMLGSIASAMLTVTSLIFSIMIVVVVQTANAYSPSVLRRYLSDTANQHVLGIMIGTFLFSLLVLRSVRSTGDREFVPTLAVNTATMLRLAQLCDQIGYVTQDPEEHQALRQFAQTLLLLANDHIELPEDRRRINQRLEQVATTLHKQPAHEQATNSPTPQ